VARSIAMHPLEHGRAPGKRAIDEAARHAERRIPVRLAGRADLLRSTGEQHCAVHFEEAAGIVVDIHEFAAVHVEDHDHLRRMLDERTVSRLALAHRLLRDMALGDVADADDVAFAPVEARLADGDLERDSGTVLGHAPDVVCGEIDVRIVDLGRAALEKLDGSLSPGLRQQIIDRAPEDLRGRVAENALARGIEGLDVAGFVDGDDGVLDVVENGLEVRGALLANLAR
jgi:hypothetical protein